MHADPEMAFVFPHFSQDTGLFDCFEYNLGTGFIRSYLQTKGIPTAQYLQEKPRTVRAVASEILELNAPVVGFTCYDVTTYLAVILAEEIKSRAPETLIVFGGPMATLGGEFILENSPVVDICCRGEGEVTCHELLLRLREGAPIDDVPGITFRRNGSLVTNPQLTCSRDPDIRSSELDVFPSPYLSGMIPGEKAPKIGVITARGCTHKCIYCTNTAIVHNTIRYHSVERVMQELEHINDELSAHHHVPFYDDAFTLNVARAKEICKRMAASDRSVCQYDCISRIDRVDEELFDLLETAGFVSVAFGLESSSPRVLNIIKKVRSAPAVDDNYKPELRFLESIEKNTALARARGLSTSVSIIVGLPGESKEDAEASVQYVENLDIDSYMHNYLLAVYGTEMHRIAEAYGIQANPSPFLLPLEMEYAYDVFSVKPGPRCIFHAALPRRHRFTIACMESFFRLNRHPERSLDPGSPSILLPSDDVEGLTPQLFSWLNEYIEMESNVFVSSTSWSKEAYKHVLKAIADGRTPTQYFHAVVNDGDDLALILLATYTDLQYAAMDRDKYHKFRRSSLAGALESPMADGTGEETIAVVQSPECIEAILSVRLDHEGGVELSGDEVRRMSSFRIENQCRWSPIPCPASLGSRMIVSPSGEVRTCVGCAAIGAVGEEVQQIEDRLRRQRQETHARRGCKDCPAAHRCSRCLLLPAFLDERDFCSLIKEKPQISMLMQLPEVLHSLAEGGHLEQPHATGVRVVPVQWPDWFAAAGEGVDVYLVTTDVSSLLIHKDTLKVLKLTTRMLRVLELTFLQSSREQLQSSLQSEYNVSEDAIQNTVSTFNKKLKEISEW